MPQNHQHAISAVTHHRNVIITLHIVVVFFYWMAQYLYVPTLPVYVRSKTDNLALVGIVLAMYGLWQAICRLPLGIVSDWFGWRKPFIMACLLLLGGGAWLMGTADGVLQILIGRALTGVAASVWVLLLVTFTGLFPTSETIRATGLLTLVSSVGRVLGTASTGFLNERGGYALAFFAAVGCAGLGLLALLPLQETRRPPQRPTLSKITALITRWDVLWPALLGAIVQYVVWGSTFSFLPLLAKQLGATNLLQSSLVTMNLAIHITGNLIVTMLAKRIGAYRLIALSVGCLASGVGLAAAAASLNSVWIAQALLGFGAGIGYPVLMGQSIRHVTEAERGTAMGLHQAIYALGMFAGPWLSGLLAERLGVQPMFAVTALLCLLTGLIGTHWLRLREQQGTKLKE